MGYACAGSLVKARPLPGWPVHMGVGWAPRGAEILFCCCNSVATAWQLKTELQSNLFNSWRSRQDSNL